MGRGSLSPGHDISGLTLRPSCHLAEPHRRGQNRAQRPFCTSARSCPSRLGDLVPVMSHLPDSRSRSGSPRPRCPAGRAAGDRAEDAPAARVCSLAFPRAADTAANQPKGIHVIVTSVVSNRAAPTPPNVAARGDDREDDAWLDGTVGPLIVRVRLHHARDHRWAAPRGAEPGQGEGVVSTAAGIKAAACRMHGWQATGQTAQRRRCAAEPRARDGALIEASATGPATEKRGGHDGL